MDDPSEPDQERALSQERRSPESDELSARLQKLKQKLEQPEMQNASEEGGASSGSDKDRSGIAMAFRLSSEFIAGVVVGAGIGYGVDTFFGTSPWGMIVFLLLGFVVAVLNVMRAAGLVAESQMRLKPAQDMQNVADDDDSGPEVKK